VILSGVSVNFTERPLLLTEHCQVALVLSYWASFEVERLVGVHCLVGRECSAKGFKNSRSSGMDSSKVGC
jgi:hypothetical protein